MENMGVDTGTNGQADKRAARVCLLCKQREDDVDPKGTCREGTGHEWQDMSALEEIVDASAKQREAAHQAQQEMNWYSKYLVAYAFVRSRSPLSESVNGHMEAGAVALGAGDGSNQQVAMPIGKSLFLKRLKELFEGKKEPAK